MDLNRVHGEFRGRKWPLTWRGASLAAIGTALIFTGLMVLVFGF